MNRDMANAAQVAAATKLRLRDALREALLTAARDRDERPDTVKTEFGLEPAWVVHERDVLLTKVNNMRFSRGLPGVSEAAIARIEQHACGHVDYADKYALLCAELVLGQSPWPLEG